MIDITKFLIISQEQFNEIIVVLKCDLISTDKAYLISYLFVNFLAYFLIIMTLVIALKIYRKMRRNLYNAKLV